jgi:hypothetical protein
MVSEWAKGDVKKWLEKLHGGDYSEHVPKFAKMDGMRLMSLSRDDLKEIVGPADGIVMYKAICVACSGVSTQSAAAEAATAEAVAAQIAADEEAEREAEDAAEDNAATEAAVQFEAAALAAAGGNVSSDTAVDATNPIDEVSRKSEPTEEEFEAIKKKSKERREARLLAKRKPHHSAFTNSIFWNFEYSKFTFGTIVSVMWALLWPVWMRPGKGRKQKEGKWDQRSGTGAF